MWPQPLVPLGRALGEKQGAAWSHRAERCDAYSRDRLVPILRVVWEVAGCQVLSGSEVSRGAGMGGVAALPPAVGCVTLEPAVMAVESQTHFPAFLAGRALREQSEARDPLQGAAQALRG